MPKDYKNKAMWLPEGGKSQKIYESAIYLNILAGG